MRANHILGIDAIKSKRTKLVPNSKLQTPCWLWTGNKQPNGYGQIAWMGKTSLAHRVFYQEYVGPIPVDLELDHLCRNRWCVNPKHLELVTSLENHGRGAKVGAYQVSNHNRKKTHCIRGHEFTPENTWISPSTGQRACRACSRLRKEGQR